MKRKKKITAALAAIIIILLLCWWLFQDQKGADRNRDQKQQIAAAGEPKMAGGPAGKKQAGPNDGTSAAPVKKRSKGWKRPDLSAEAIEAYVAGQGRSADALLSAAIVGRGARQRYLQEALEKFPSNARVIAAALLSRKFDDQKAKLVENLRRAAPGNALPDLIAAQMAAAAKPQDPGAIMAALTGAAKASSFDDFQKDFNRLEGDIYLRAGGAPELDAYGGTIHYEDFDSAGIFRDLKEAVNDQLAAAENPADVERWAALGLSSVKRLSDSPMMNQRSSGLALEKSFLKYFIGMGQTTALTMSPREYLKEVSTSSDNVQESLKYYIAFDKDSPELARYVSLARDIGTYEAIRVVREEANAKGK